ncbi:MAG: carboxypeptidase regulatory-like domain-containing protein [Acidobacteriota bacterium]
MKRLNILTFFTLLFLSTTIALAQNTRELRGTVIDETGAYIVAATLELDDGNGNKYTAQSNEQGRYQINGIVPGNYTLTVSAEGFATVIDKMDLTARRTTNFNPTLKVIISEQLEVKSDSASISIEPDQNLSAITITEKELEALPDDPEELLQTLREMAGASGSPGDAQILVDGFRESGRLPSKESIQTIRINSNPFAAEFAEPGISRIEIVTKPGSDTYHGGFRFNINDESLNGRNAFARFRSPLQIRNYGGELTGPIIQNRWGFQLDFNRRELDENDVVNAIVLDPVSNQSQSFVTTVSTPNRLFNFSIGTDYLFGKNHTLGLRYRYTKNSASNQGLQSGFDLPERAFNRVSRDNTIRASITSILNTRAVNEFRVEIGRRSFRSRALTDDPAVLVLDAFNAGGNQGSLFSENVNDSMELSNSLAYTYKQHTFKFGFRVNAVHLDNVNRANFGGTFTFGTDFERDAAGNPIPDANGKPITITPLEHYRRTLSGLAGYRPSQFSIVTGDPFIGFSQWDAGFFVQDDWRLSPRLSLSYGLRQELQTHLDDKINFAPRFGLAWSPDKERKSTIRVGGGVFYNRVDTSITFDTVRLDGQHQRQVIIQQPAFFSTIPTIPLEVINSQRLSTTRIKADDLKNPYSVLIGVSYERQLPLKMFGAVTYSFQRGVHLLRTRNINAPLPDSNLLPFPTLGPILQFESSGLSTRNELRLNLRTNFSRKFTLFGNYTLSSTRTNTDSAFTAPANSFDLSTEFGRASSDQRHQLFVGSSFSLPWSMRISTFIFAASGRPFNILTGRDNNGDTQFTDRPAFAAPGDAGAVVTKFGSFNPNPRPGDPIIPRNFGNGPGQLNVNLNLSKTFGFGALPRNNVASQNGSMDPRGGFGGPGGGGFRGGPGGGGFGGGGFGGPRGRFGDTAHRYNLTISINMQNLFNRTNLAGFNGVLSSPLFGQANRSLSARRIELSMRFNF